MAARKKRAKRPSMRKAIDEMCKQCLYDPNATGLGTWKQQIEACTASDCALYPLRPKSAAKGGDSGA